MLGWGAGSTQLQGDRNSHPRDPSRPHPMHLFIWLSTCSLCHVFSNKQCFSEFCELLQQIIEPVLGVVAGL